MEEVRYYSFNEWLRAFQFLSLLSRDVDAVADPMLRRYYFVDHDSFSCHYLTQQDLAMTLTPEGAEEGYRLLEMVGANHAYL